MKWRAAIVCSLTLSQLTAADHSLNNAPLLVAVSSREYTFIVSGHFYGTSNSISGYPASTVVANVDLFNATKASFFLSTGDMFQNVEKDRPGYDLAFLSRLTMPLFNTVGNHDLDGGKYSEIYGATYYAVDVGPDRLLVLDAERDESNIEGEQLKLLTEAVEAMKSGTVRHLFILTHRPIWAEGNARYEAFFKHNTRSAMGNDFQAEVMPLLKEASSYGSVTWFSGSMGGSAPYPIFLDSPENNIQFVQSAVRDVRSDAVLLVSVAEGGIAFKAISLHDGTQVDASKYSSSAWEAKLGEPEGFNWRLLPYLIKSTIASTYFWWGAGSMLVLTLLLHILRRRSR